MIQLLCFHLPSTHTAEQCEVHWLNSVCTLGLPTEWLTELSLPPCEYSTDWTYWFGHQIASGWRGFCVFFHKYQIGWNVHAFLNMSRLVFLQLWLTYLEFLSPCVHKTCIFKLAGLCKIEMFQLLCDLGELLDSDCSFVASHCAVSAPPSCYGLEVQIHVCCKVKRASVHVPPQSLLQNDNIRNSFESTWFKKKKKIACEKAYESSLFDYSKL